MDSSTVDPLNDTPTLPELSFDDLLDDSPVKVVRKSSGDPLDFGEEHQSLHTPGPKKPRLTIMDTNRSDSLTTPKHAAQRQKPTIQTESATNHRPTAKVQLRPNAVTKILNRDFAQRTNLAPATTATAQTLTTTTILNGKSILSKTIPTSATSNHQLLKINPKSIIAPASNTTTSIATSTPAAATGNKTFKASNGQIFYLQKSSAMLPSVRLATTTATASTTPSAASSQAATTASTVVATITSNVTSKAGGNKPVSIQVFRSADGTLIPVKSTAATPNTTASSAATARATKGQFTLSPTKIAGKKIITNCGNQVVIKAAQPLKVSAAAATATTNVATSTSTAATTSNSSSTSITASTKASATPTTTNKAERSADAANSTGKLLVQSTNSKHIVVSNQQLIKLSPKPPTAAGAASSGHFQAIHIPGKPGLQYVRVLPTAKSSAAAGRKTNASSDSAAAPIPTTSSMKIINPTNKKFAVVRTSAGATKMLLTAQPKNFSPITSKVQKTIVTVPTLRKISDPKTSPNANVSGVVTSDNQSSANSSQKPNNNNNKNNSTKDNSNLQAFPIQSITSDELETTKQSAGNRVVVMPRSMLRSNNLQPLQRHSSSGNNQSTSAVNEGQSSSGALSPPPKKLYSVLKTRLDSLSPEDPHPVELKTNAELKSLIICGQARALMDQTQLHKHKAQQMLQKQRMLHQQQQQLQLQMQQHRQEQLQLEKEKKQQKLLEHFSKLHSSLQRQPLGSSGSLPGFNVKLEPFDPNDGSKDENVGIRRKHCNCTKSQCLKLYCDCFANGEFCQDCNCKDCFNNLKYQDERQKAIKTCLERNPSAFKPKITTAQDHGDMRLHNKGCNCKRSGCLKNYCECYEAKIPCSSNCRCFGCRNIEDRPDLDMDPFEGKSFSKVAGGAAGSGKSIMQAGGVKRTYEKMDRNQQMGRDTTMVKTMVGVRVNKNDENSCSSGTNVLAPPEKQQCNFITQEVIDATIQCMISQADECEKNGLPSYQTEKMIMEELGRCLVEIIDFSIRNTDTSFAQD